MNTLDKLQIMASTSLALSILNFVLIIIGIAYYFFKHYKFEVVKEVKPLTLKEQDKNALTELLTLYTPLSNPDNIVIDYVDYYDLWVVVDFHDTHARLFQVYYEGSTRRILNYWHYKFTNLTYSDFIEKYYDLVDWDTDDNIFKRFETTLADKFVGGLKAYKNVNTL